MVKRGSSKRTEVTAPTGQSPGTNKLADILLGLQSVDAGSEVIESDVTIEGNESCNCRKSRCLKLYVLVMSWVF